MNRGAIMSYAVNLLSKSSHEDTTSDNEPLWEESVYLVQADSEEEAKRAGEVIGKTLDVKYTSATGDFVHWTFERVESVYEILDETIGHGTEVFSRFLRTSEVESLLTPFED